MRDLAWAWVFVLVVAAPVRIGAFEAAPGAADGPPGVTNERRAPRAPSDARLENLERKLDAALERLERIEVGRAAGRRQDALIGNLDRAAATGRGQEARPLNALIGLLY